MREYHVMDIRSRAVAVSRWFVIATAAVVIASCGILPPKETPNVYVLPSSQSATAAQTNAQPLVWQLRVDTPDADGMIGDTGIVVMPEPGRITVYANARWSNPAPLLLRQRLTDAFLATHQLPAVTDEDDSLHADFVLSGDLRALQSEYRNGAPVVVVRYDARLREGGSREVMVTKTFEVTQNPSGVAVPQVVQAFGAACDQLSAQVVAWTLAQAQQDWEKQQAQKVSPASTGHDEHKQRSSRRRH